MSDCEHGETFPVNGDGETVCRHCWEVVGMIGRQTDGSLTPRTMAYDRGYSDGLWSTYQPNANDDRDEYDRGHAAGVAYRAGRMAQ